MYKVVKIGAETSNGNNIIKLLQQTEVDLGVFGKKDKKVTYYMAVQAGTHQLEVDQEVELPMDKLEVVERPFTNEETGEVIMLKWLHAK